MEEVETGDDESRAEIPGLTNTQAAANLRQFGRNFIPRPRPRPAWLRLRDQLVHFFALMLWIAGVLAIIAHMSQLGIAIFVVIDSLHQQWPSDFLDVSGFRNPRSQLFPGAFRSGYLACFCYWDLGTSH